MNQENFDMGNVDIAWCPGCGNFGILEVLKQALVELEIKPQNCVVVSGIGQAAKIPHYIRANVFNGLHGRYLSSATAIKAINPDLVVIAASGDGCTYSEGGNHFIHTIRRNSNITNLVHNNMVYGLTKGQATPTSQIGFTTPVQVDGVFLEPFNPLAVAIALDASFVARAYIGDKERTKEIIKKAITHKGYALVDIFQPCVVYNKVNTYKWFKEHTYYLSDSYDPYNKIEAFRRSLEQDKLPLGMFYINSKKKTFEENLKIYQKNSSSLCKRQLDRREQLKKFIYSKRTM